MDASDPYRSTNPWTLARYLKNSSSRCPVCRERCSFDVSVDKEEIIHMEADCPKCGRTTLVPYLEEDMDLAILVGDTKRHYEPDQRCFELASEIGATAVQGAGADILSKYSEIASIYGNTRRPAESERLGRDIAAEYRNGIETHPEYRDLCLAQVCATANVIITAGDNKKALELYDEYLPLAEGNESGKAFALILARAFSQFSEGDAKIPTGAVREVIASLDRMRSENRIPADDPFIRSRAYEALAVLLSAKNDKTGSMKAMRKSLEDSQEVLSRSVTDDGLRWMNRCAREYAFACFHADMKKRSMEALKDSIKLCSANREKYPYAYAEALLERGMFISDSGADLPPYLRKDMDEAIAILSKPDENGKYDPLLPIAYYYRSMTGPDKDKLDGADLEKAYEAVRDGVKSGDVPESVLTSVMDTYATYLDAYEEEKAVTVRRELAEMGIWIRPPLKKKPQ